MQAIENYKKEKLIIDLVWANVFSILLIIPIVLIFGLPYYLIWNPAIDFRSIMDSANPNGAILGFIIVGIVVHELIHGITWAKFAKNGFRSIKFGVLWKMLTPYCHCKEPLTVKQYIIGAIAPAIILGIVPSIIAILIGNFGLLLFGMFFTMAAAGDFLMVKLISKENKDDMVQDHPSECGCYIYRKIEDKETYNNVEK